MVERRIEPTLGALPRAWRRPAPRPNKGASAPFGEAIFSLGAELATARREELLEPAGSHHPAWLANCLGEGGARIEPVWVGERLAGLFAIEAQSWRWGWPQRLVKSWQSDLTFDGTPLIDRRLARSAIKGFMRKQKRPILFQTIPADGSFLATLAGVGRELAAPVRIVREWERAALRPAGSFEHWFDTNFERKRKKEYRRLRARLGEQGKLESLSWSEAEPVQRWIDELLDLEARGWKGKEGTAVAGDPAMKAALTKAIHALAREGSLRFWKLAFNGEAIAMMFALVSGGRAWLGKIAYDETFAKYSPGVLLILDATQAFFAEKVALVDSCAIPGHPMIDNIWRERIRMCDVLVGKPQGSRILFSLMIAAEQGRMRLREAAKDFYYRITRRRRS